MRSAFDVHSAHEADARGVGPFAGRGGSFFRGLKALLKKSANLRLVDIAPDGEAEEEHGDRKPGDRGPGTGGRLLLLLLQFRQPRMCRYGAIDETANVGDSGARDGDADK